MAVELRILTDESTNTGFTIDLKDNEDFPLAINFELAAIEDIGKTKSTFSKTFKIPATDENNKNLSSLYYSSTSTDSGVKYRNVCIVIEDGTPLSKGYIKIKNVIETQMGREYEAVFFGSNFAWIDKFRDLSLRDLDFTSDNHVWNSTNVEASWEDSGQPMNSDVQSYTYPIISYGNFVDDEVTFQQLRPAVFHRSIIDKCFETLLDGTTEQYSINSTFLDGTYFKRLIMPFTSGDFNSPLNKNPNEDLEVSRTTTRTTNINVPANPFDFDLRKVAEVIRFETVDAGNSSNVGGQAYYDAVDSDNNGLYLPIGRYTIEGFITVEQDRVKFTTSGPGPAITNYYTDFLNTRLEVSRKVISFARRLVTDPIEWNPESNLAAASNTFKFSFEYQSKGLTSGFDFLQFHLLYVINPSSGCHMDIKYKLSDLKVIKQAQLVEGHTVELSNTLPDVKAVNYFKGLAHNYNLYVDTNEWTREVKIEPRDDFYKPNAQAKNWTSKLDLSRGFNIQYIHNYSRTLSFEYQEDDSDEYAKSLSQSMEIKLGAGEVDLDQRFNRGTTSFINPLFAGTVHARVNIGRYSSKQRNDQRPIIPTMWNNVPADGSAPEATYSFAPRTLFYNYSAQTDNDSTNINWLYDGVTKTEIPTGYFIDTVEGSTLDEETLHYGGSNGLISRYYGGQLGLLNEGVNIICYFDINKEDINTLDLSTPIYLSAPTQIAGYYVIQSIRDYKPFSDKPTKVILSKIVDVSAPTIKEKYVEKWKEVAKDGSAISDAAKNKQKVTLDNSGSKAGKGYYDKWKAQNATDYEAQRADYTEYGTGVAVQKDITSFDRDKYSVALSNGTNNYARPFSGNIAFGNGVKAIGSNQTVLGNHNKPNINHSFQIGGGTESNPLTPISVTSDGRPQFYGGEIYMEDSNGNLINVITEVDNRYDKVYLDTE